MNCTVTKVRLKKVLSKGPPRLPISENAHYIGPPTFLRLRNVSKIDRTTLGDCQSSSTLPGDVD